MQFVGFFSNATYGTALPPGFSNEVTCISPSGELSADIPECVPLMTNEKLALNYGSTWEMMKQVKWILAIFGSIKK